MMSVVTREPCRLLVLPRPKFRKVHALFPHLKDRIRDMHKQRTNFMKAKVLGSSKANDVAQREEQAAAQSIQRIARQRRGLG